MVDNVAAGTRRVTTWPWITALLFAAGAALSVIQLAPYRPWAALALLAAPLALRWPVALIGGSAVLMLAHWAPGGDQTLLGQAAWNAYWSGESPWQVFDLGGWSNPFAYGPLAMLTAQVPWLEATSAIGLLVVLLRVAPLTMALLAGFPPFVNLALSGVNDFTPALLIVGALLLLRTRPLVAAGVLGVAIAIKPYAAAWALPMVGFGGIVVLGVGAAVSALLWAPVLPYLPDYLSMTARVSAYTGTPLKYAALILAPLTLLVRRWEWVGLSGAMIFGAVMLFGEWQSAGYLVVIVAVVGMALELRVPQQREVDDGLRHQRVVDHAVPIRGGEGHEGVAAQLAKLP
jgi:hypothetical protein